jgi:glutathione S-transferase
VTGRRIYHVAERAHWDAAVAAGDYRRSTRDQTLDEVGYLHGANADQVAGVLQRYYLDATDLVLLAVDADLVADLLRDENTSGGTELFPHLYGPLPVDAVVVVTGERAAPPAPETT